MSTDQTTIDRLRAELAEARAVATKLQATNHELRIEFQNEVLACCELRAANRVLQSRLGVIQAYAKGQKARHEALQGAPDGVDWSNLFELVVAP